MTDASGRLDGCSHHFPIRVYFEDTDAFGVVYNARYLGFLERARTEMMRLLGIPHAEMMADHGAGVRRAYGQESERESTGHMEPTMMGAAAQAGGAMASHDLSVVSLFLAADLVVKLVMLMLLVASVGCWAVIFEKSLRIRRLNAAADQFEDSFWSGGSLDALFDQVGKAPADPMSAIFAAGMREWRHASDRGLTASGTMRASLQQRVERVMSLSINREMAEIEKHMTFLASVGSTAPFIGLFGTVWGIMDSFTSIANTNNTSLAVVAPGIAEALFATALGLLAAIPAAVAYNKFATDIGRYGDRLEAFSVEFAAILSRHLEGGG